MRREGDDKLWWVLSRLRKFDVDLSIRSLPVKRLYLSLGRVFGGPRFP